MGHEGKGVRACGTVEDQGEGMWGEVEAELDAGEGEVCGENRERRVC